MKIKTNISKASVALSIALLTAPSAVADISVVGTTTDTVRATDFTISFPANTADKLVVVVTGEHSFNNVDGALRSLTYDDVELIQAIYRPAQVAGSDVLYHGIWYLDNPSTTTGDLRVQVTNRGTVSAFLVNGTAEGHGATGITEVGARSISLTTTQTDSMVFAAFGVGGDGNTGNTDSIDTDPPLVEVSAVKDPSNWQGHVVGTQIVATPSSNTFSFTGGIDTGAVVAAVEFFSADGTAGLPFTITDIQYTAESDEVTLTWAKTGAASFAAKISTDLVAFDTVLLAGITEAEDENPGDAETITETFTLPEGFAGSLKLFFRIEEE